MPPENDAIQPDVSADQTSAADPLQQQPAQAETQEPRPDPRAEAIDRIAQSRRQQFEDESGVDINPEPTTEPPKAEVAAAPPADQLDAQLADDDRVIDESLLRGRIKLKINGRDELVPIEQIIRNEQKSRAADERLAEATRILREAKQGTAPRDALSDGETADTTQTPEQPPSDLSQTVRDRVKAALDDVFSGKEGDAAEKLTEAMLSVSGRNTAPPAQQFDTVQIAHAVKSELERESALEAFGSKYHRIVTDPDLPMIADRTLARKMNDEGLSFKAALEATGQEIYQRFGFKVADPKAEPTDTPTTTSRTQTLATRKANMDVPVGRMVSAAQAEPEPVSSEQNRSQTIAQIAAARRPPNPALDKAMGRG